MYKFEAENNFFYNIDHFRGSKIIFQIDIFKSIIDVKGDICEFGIFKGNSLNRLIFLRDFYSKEKIFAFDTQKKKNYNKFLNQSKNKQLSFYQLKKKLIRKNMFSKVQLVKGDVLSTLKKTKLKKLSYVLLDLDIYEPTKYVLNYIWPKMQKKGIILLDNYNVFDGETKAVDEFTRSNKIKIRKKKFFRKFYFLKK